MGTNTSYVVIEPTGSGLRPSYMEANAQTSIPIVDVLLLSGLGDHISMPHVNLSILGCKPNSLRTSGLRSPPMRAQEVSAIPQLDGSGSLPTRDPTRGTGDRFQNGLNKTPPREAPMCREFPQVEEENILEEIVMVMVIEDHIETQRPPDQGGYPVGESPDRGRGPPIEEVPLDLLEKKYHQAHKEFLG